MNVCALLYLPRALKGNYHRQKWPFAVGILAVDHLGLLREVAPAPSFLTDSWLSGLIVIFSLGRRGGATLATASRRVAIRSLRPEGGGPHPRRNTAGGDD